MKKFLIIFFLLINLIFTHSAFSSDRNVIYVYNDEGVSQESLLQTVYTFTHLLKTYSVKTINAQQIKEKSWLANAVLLVIPGGADLPYAKKLKGKGNKIIKQYIKKGGTFLGICAGAYYGSSYVEFDKNGPLEVLGKRELRLFKNRAIGPILAPYNYKNQSGSRAAKIYTILPDITKITLFYNGGGFFKDVEKYSNTRVIGVYENKLPAIIFINYGKGKVLLSGIHFEYSPYLLNSQDEYIKKIIEPLKDSNSSREFLFIHLMKLIGLKTK